MANEYGDRNASEPESTGESSRKMSPGMEAASVPLMVGSFSIDDAIAMHLVDCDQCRESIINLRPLGIGQRSGHCNAYWQLQLMRAEYEGKVNNVVAHNEYGDEAKKGGPLQ